MQTGAFREDLFYRLHKVKAARRLGLTRGQLYSRLRKHGMLEATTSPRLVE